MKYRTNKYWLGLALLLTVSCDVAPKKCRYKPGPVFSARLPHVIQYNFEREGAQSLESVLLDTGILLEVEQEVCDLTQQEFRFGVKGDYSKYADEAWLQEAVRQLVFLSTLSPAQVPLKIWADAIEDARTQMRLGEEYELQPGIYVSVDKVLGAQESVLIVRLIQK
ncbi:MAG: hypothetical protein ACK4NS_04910 [Saprospiraceae bacterium]